MGGSYGKHLIDGEIQYLSPSGMSKYDHDQMGGCALKGWLHYVKGLKEPFTNANKTGTIVHKEFQTHLETGEMCLGPIALTAKQFIPKRRKHLEIEHRMHKGLLTAGGINTVGEIDVLDLGWQGEILTVNEDGDEVTEYSTVEVLDWKSTSNVQAHSKAADELMGTIQMPLYGAYALARDPEAEFVRLSHVYMQTRGNPDPRKNTVRVSRRDIESRWVEIESISRTIQGYVAETDHTKIPQNRNSCMSWNKRCMHSDTFCAKGVPQSIDDIFGVTKASQLRKEDTKMNVEEELAALEAGASKAGALGETPAPVEVPSTWADDWRDILSCGNGFPPLDKDATAVFEKANGLTLSGGTLPGEGNLGGIKPLSPELVATVAGNLRAKGDVKAPEPVEKPAIVITEVKATVAVEMPLTPDPVEAPAPEPEPEGLHIETVSPQAPQGESEALTAARKCIEKGSFSNMRKPDMGEVIIEVLAMKGGAGERHVSGVELDAAHILIAKLRKENEELQYTLDHTPSKAQLEETKGLVLYIDTLPSEPCDRIDAYARKVCALLEEQTGAKDIRCSDDNRLSFGKWKGALAACVRAVPPEDGTYLVETAGNEIFETIAATLRESASRFAVSIK